jgi:hypothetical protein
MSDQRHEAPTGDSSGKAEQIGELNHAAARQPPNKINYALRQSPRCIRA